MKEGTEIVLKQGQIVAFVPVTDRERRVMNVEPQGLKELPAMVVSAVAGELVMAVFTNDVHKPVMRRYNVPHERDVQREDGVPVGDYWKEMEGGEAAAKALGNSEDIYVKVGQLANIESNVAVALGRCQELELQNEVLVHNNEQLKSAIVVLEDKVNEMSKIKTLQDELAALKKSVSALEKSGKRNTMTPPPPEEQKETPPAAGDGDKK